MTCQAPTAQPSSDLAEQKTGTKWPSLDKRGGSYCRTESCAVLSGRNKSLRGWWIRKGFFRFRKAARALTDLGEAVPHGMHMAQKLTIVTIMFTLGDPRILPAIYPARSESETLATLDKCQA